MKSVRIFFAVATFAVALSVTLTLMPTSTTHAATRNPNQAASSCSLSNVIPTTNLMGSRTFLRYQNLDYTYTAYFQATQTGYTGGGTFTAGWWIYKGNAQISSRIVQNWTAAWSPIYTPITGLQVGGKLIYGTSPTEFYPAVYNCDGYWWPPQQVTA
jgi:hypothetical protein